MLLKPRSCRTFQITVRGKHKNKTGFDAERKYWLLQEGFSAARGWGDVVLHYSQSSSPHLLWLSGLFAPAPVGNVSMRCKKVRDAQDSWAYSYSVLRAHTNTHSSLFHLHLRVFGSLTGAAFFVRIRSHSNSLSNLSLDFCRNTPTHTTVKHAPRPDIFNILTHQYWAKPDLQHLFARLEFQRFLMDVASAGKIRAR